MSEGNELSYEHWVKSLKKLFYYFVIISLLSIVIIPLLFLMHNYGLEENNTIGIICIIFGFAGLLTLLAYSTTISTIAKDLNLSPRKWVFLCFFTPGGLIFVPLYFSILVGCKVLKTKWNNRGIEPAKV